MAAVVMMTSWHVTSRDDIIGYMTHEVIDGATDDIIMM